MRTVAIFLTLATVASAQQSYDRDDYVSEASFLIASYVPQVTDHSAAAMAKAGQALLDALEPPLRQRAALPLDSPERRAWTNLPARPDAGGVRLGDCSPRQVQAFCDLLRALLSEQGYDKFRHIMLADDQLLRNGKPRAGFGTENFAFMLFGNPTAEGPWGCQLDGHHVGLNIAVHGDAVTISPSFIGTQPEAFRIGPHEYRPLAGEIDQAFALANSLTDQQLAEAVLSPKRGRISTGPGHDGEVPTPRGVAVSSFDQGQRDLLLSLISEWVHLLPPAQAERRMQRLSEELDEMKLAWRGSKTAGSDVSYRIQGPTLIIEYACQDLGGNPLDHLHTMYRDPTNEYGGQLTRENH